MGLFDAITRKVQSDLEYKTASTVTEGVVGAIKKGFRKNNKQTNARNARQ
jgi:hypothetical protein